MPSALPNSAAWIIQRYLIDAAVGVDPGTAGTVDWRVYRHKEPDQPDNIITVFNTSPVPDGRAKTEIVDHPGVQIQARARNAEDADAKCREIVNVLAECRDGDVQHRTVVTWKQGATVYNSSYQICCAAKTSGPIPIGEDQRGRFNFSVNFVLTLRLIETLLEVP